MKITKIMLVDKLQSAGCYIFLFNISLKEVTLIGIRAMGLGGGGGLQPP